MIERGEDGFYHPGTEDEVCELVKQARAAGLKVRVRGSAHSVPASIFAAAPGHAGKDATAMDLILDKMIGVEFDVANRRVTVQGGCHFGLDPADPTETSTRENSLVYQLQQRGWALPITGGIIHQTMGGFLSTGSSGGSLTHSVNAAVVTLRLVDGTGTVRELHRSDDLDDAFYAAGVSMGLLGVVTSVTFECEQTFDISGSERTSDYRRCEYALFEESPDSRLPLRDFFKDTEYGRCMWWPQRKIEKIVIWQAKRLEGPRPKRFPKRYHEFMVILGSTKPANVAVGLLMRFFKGINPPGPEGKLGKLINRFLLEPMFRFFANVFLVSGSQEFCEDWGDGLPMDNRVDYNWTPTEFSEMWVPVERTQEVMRELQAHYGSAPLSQVGTYSVEIYATPRSRFWLSPAYQQDVVKFDMFWFGKNEGDPAQVFYPQFWELMRRFDCRFHWGKYMPIDPAYVSARYPRWDDFMAVRAEMDPDQVFVTDYWRARLGIALN